MPSSQSAEESLLRRMQVMAQFIEERHAVEFAGYWGAHWPGRASVWETLDVFSSDEFAVQHTILRKVIW